MERDSLHGIDRSLSLYNPNSRNPIMEQPFLSRTYRSFSPSNFPSKGLLNAPPLSLPHSAPIFSLPPPSLPPLLPLPTSLPRRTSSLPGRPYSSPAIDTNGARETKKSTKSSSTKNNIPKKAQYKRSSDSTVTSKSRREVAKNLARENSVIERSSCSLIDMVPRSVVFTVSPPPSSLPLPTFCLRPKIRIDAGASDDLRRLLRLQWLYIYL